MFLPLLSAGLPAPTQMETINLITKEPPAIVQQVEPKELTVEEKIASNFYKCDELTQWIRKDNAQCLPKPIHTVANNSSEPRTAPTTGSTGLNGYYAGQCTGWVAQQRYVPSGWGDASNWGYAAKSAGWTVSDTPVAGAIAWRYGHVAYVISVGAGTVLISEANYDYNGSVRTISVPTSSYQYIY